MTFVTIVTIVKDHAQGLERTLSSIVAQNYKNWEVVIVVGKSSDSSLKIAEDFVTSHFGSKVIKQELQGIFEAMNEGLENVRGEFVWFMNAGDTFANTLALEAAVQEMNHTNVGLIIGGYEIEGESKIYSYDRKTISAVSFAFSRRGGCHQAMLFRASEVRKFHGYDPQYRVNSDFDLVLKVIKSSGGLRVPDVYASIEPGGVADQNLFQVHSEKHAARKEFFGKYSPVIVLSLLWTLAARLKIVLKKL